MPGQNEDDPEVQRWLDAQSVLHRQPTPAAQSRQRRSRRIRILLVIALPIIATGLGLMWDLSGHRGPLAGTFNPGPTLRAMGWVLVAAGPVLWIIGLIWMIRARQFRLAWRSPLVNLTRKDRKQLVTLIRHDQDPPQGQEQLAAYVANRMAGQYPLLVFFGGFVAQASGPGFIQNDRLLVWSTPVLLVLFAIVAVLVARDVRTASRWLASHTHQGPPSTSTDN